MQALRVVSALAWLAAGACSSSTHPTAASSKHAKGGGAGKGGADASAGKSPCAQASSALAKRRDACEFESGALAADTLGACSGSAIPIEHVVVIMQENRSFDQYFGHLPGHGQDDVDVPKDVPENPAGDGSGAISWHHETAYCVEDTDHGWTASHDQWNDGQQDGFARSNVKPDDPSGQRAMGYYDQSDIPFYFQLASTFAISDRYFCSLLGPTYPNRMFFSAGTSFGIVTTDIAKLAPAGVPQIYRALGDKGVSWKVYRTNLPSLLLYPDFAGDSAQADHIVGVEEFAADAASGALPQVSFLDAGFEQGADVETDEHEPADIQLGQHFVWQQVTAAIAGPDWKSTAIFLTYDEHGGLYDHVSPPPACAPDDTLPAQNPELGGFDRLGFRVPLTLISPYARRGYVSHEVHSHTSILRFIQAKFELPAMTKRDANSDAMLDLFDFDSAPRLETPDFAEPAIDQAAIAACQAAFPSQ
ncbi:MAG: phospholipase C [Polyangiales bacterium]